MLLDGRSDLEDHADSANGGVHMLLRQRALVISRPVDLGACR